MIKIMELYICFVYDTFSASGKKYLWILSDFVHPQTRPKYALKHLKSPTKKFDPALFISAEQSRATAHGKIFLLLLYAVALALLFEPHNEFDFLESWQ